MTATVLAAPSARTYSSLRAAWIPLLALCLAFFVEMVDNTLLTIALPTIGRDLGSSTTGLQWITGAYSLVFGAMLLTAGSAADRLGRRRVLLTGLAAFGTLSLLVLAVSTSGELIALRAVLGLAAAMMAPVTNSLVFRLFDDETLRMRAMTVMIIVGMSGFILGPVLGGTALAHLPWQWLLLVNAPLALIAWIGVRRGVPADRSEDLTADRLDLPGALLSLAAMGLACLALTSGAEAGWTSPATLACAIGAAAALAGFVLRERTAAAPMLDLAVLRLPTVRGAALAQLGSSLAMAGIGFGLILHLQGAWGWSPVASGLANLPMILTMVLATPLAEKLMAAVGHRIACLIGVGLITASLLGMSVAVAHGYAALAVCLVVFAAGLRLVMTICAVALIGAMPEDRTSLSAALNDTAQELGSSFGTAAMGTVIALLVTVALPSGAWSADLAAAYVHGEQITYAALAVLVALIAGTGALTLTASRETDEHA